MSSVDKRYLPNMEDETPPYYEKYRVQKEDPSHTGQEIPYYEKYRVQPKKSFYQENIKEPANILLSNAAAGIRSIPRTGFELLKSVVGATGGDLSKLEEAQENAPEWLKKFGSSAFPTFEDVRARQIAEGAKEEETPVEKGIGKIGRLFGEAPATGGVGGVKGALALTGLGAGLQAGEEAEFGPIGQLFSGIAGSLTLGGIKNAAKGIANVVKNPKKTLAEIAAFFTPKDKLALQKEIIEDARKSGVKLDLGSSTDNRLIKGIQAYLAQSRLSGSALENLKKSIFSDIKKEYKSVADAIGEAKYQTSYEAGNAIQTGIKEARDLDLSKARDLYSSARKRGGEFQVFPGKVAQIVKDLEEQLGPGSIKSTEQKAVLDAVQKLKSDVLTPSGDLKGARINDLINDKIALNDIIDYEVQGGAKQLLKKAVQEIDATIQSHGKEDPLFAKEWNQANKKFAEHAKTYRNKNINSALKTQDPVQILTKMNTTQGIRDIQKALGNSAEGKKLFGDLKRFKVDDLLAKHLEDGISQQAKFGTFSNAITKGKNGEILRELLGPENFKRLDNLGKTSGRLAESANKFLNTSQSGTLLLDTGIVAKLFGDVAQFFLGNPWPVIRSGAIYGGVRGLSKLLSDPEFLRLSEEAILAQKQNNPQVLQQIFEAIGQIAKTNAKGAPQVSSQDRQEKEKIQ